MPPSHILAKPVWVIWKIYHFAEKNFPGVFIDNTTCTIHGISAFLSKENLAPKGL